MGGNTYIERPNGGVQNTRANALETRGGRPETRALAHEANALAFLNRQQRTRAEEVERVARQIHRANPERFPGLALPPPEPEEEEEEARRLDERDREEDALHLAALHDQWEREHQREEFRGRLMRAHNIPEPRRPEPGLLPPEDPRHEIAAESARRLIQEADEELANRDAAAAAKAQQEVAEEAARLLRLEEEELMGTQDARFVRGALNPTNPRLRPGWAALPDEVRSRGLRAFGRIWWSRYVVHTPDYDRRLGTFHRTAARRYFHNMSRLDATDIRHYFNRGVASRWFPAEGIPSDSDSDSELFRRPRQVPIHRPTLVRPLRPTILATEADDGYADSEDSAGAQERHIRELDRAARAHCEEEQQEAARATMMRRSHGELVKAGKAAARLRREEAAAENRRLAREAAADARRAAEAARAIE